MSIIIGLTGPTGAGKSIASETVREMGIRVIDCDKVARQTVVANSNALKALVNVFGVGILNSDGTLNRKALAQIAFSTKDNTKLLNETLLPYIVDKIKSNIGDEDILLDAPTLFESGIDDICTYTVAVLSNGDNRLKRILQRDGITEDEANLRMSAGKDDEYYISKAGHIIYNNGDIDTFMAKSSQLFRKLYGGNK